MSWNTTTTMKKGCRLQYVLYTIVNMHFFPCLFPNVSCFLFNSWDFLEERRMWFVCSKVVSIKWNLCEASFLSPFVVGQISCLKSYGEGGGGRPAGGSRFNIRQPTVKGSFYLNTVYTTTVILSGIYIIRNIDQTVKSLNGQWFWPPSHSLNT